MTRKLLVLAASAVVVAGCETQKLGRVGTEPRRDITYAARAQYPGNPQRSDRVQAVAIDNPNEGRLEIYNLTTQTIASSTVWVNGAFLKQIDSIAPKGSTSVRYSELLEAGPGVNDLKSLNQSVSRVELQTPDGLYSIQGPATK